MAKKAAAAVAKAQAQESKKKAKAAVKKQVSESEVRRIPSRRHAGLARSGVVHAPPLVHGDGRCVWRVFQSALRAMAPQDRCLHAAMHVPLCCAARSGPDITPASPT